MDDVRRTRLVTRDMLLWSSWGLPDVHDAIAKGAPVLLTDGGYVHADAITMIYPAEIWIAREARAEALREERRANPPPPQVGSPAWVEERWWRRFWIWR